jgi:transcription termination factor Rho
VSEKEACVSVDAHELERAALQKKDREQLQAIARAMGGKPSSRSRKDQLIDVIMDLAGVPGPTPSPAAASTPASTVAATAAAEDHREHRAETNGDAPPARGDPPRSSASHDLADSHDLVGGAGGPTPPGPRTLPSVPSTTTSVGEAAPSAPAQPSAEPPVGAAAHAAPTSHFVFAPDDPGPGGDDDPGPRTARRRSSNGRDGRDGREHEPSARPTDRAAQSAEDRSPDQPSQTGSDASGEDRTGSDRAGSDRAGPGGADAAGTGLSGADGGGPDSTAADRAGPDGAGGARGVDADQGEAGSRRRRRRGKDRNRPDERPEVRGDVRTDRVERDGQSNGVAAGPVAASAPRPAPDDAVANEPVAVGGYLDLRDEGYGFLRVRGFLPSKEDVYVPSKFVRQYSLRKGDHLEGSSRPAGRGEKNPALLRVDLVNGVEPEAARSRRRFEDLTPLFPDEKLRLELRDDPTNMTARIIDLIAPIGKGQRGLIVSPPKAGKTTIMKQIAQSIETNNPEVKLVVLLVDERPEEVTDMRRSVKGEVVASTFDRPSDEHTAVAELTIERAKRMVEMGEDVVIILDGITRLARAYNLAAPATGRIMSGGIDTGALYPPKKFFGAARNVEEGGSLTILATALVETGSKMDEVIFEEFKGTGNMELRLDRRMAEKRIYPAIDVDASSTRHEELLFERRQLQMVWKLRRVLSGLAESNGGLELLVDRMKTFRSNDEFLNEIAKAPS